MNREEITIYQNSTAQGINLIQNGFKGKHISYWYFSEKKLKLLILAVDLKTSQLREHIRIYHLSTLLLDYNYSRSGPGLGNGRTTPPGNFRPRFSRPREKFNFEPGTRPGFSNSQPGYRLETQKTGPGRPMSLLYLE